MENALGSLIDQDPAPTMFVYPSDELAERTVEAKLEPMIRQCKALAEKYRENDSKRLALKFRDMIVYLTGANSPASLASTPIRYLFLDEVDKFPGATKKRPTRIPGHRANKDVFQPQDLYGLTPTLKTGPIWKAKEEADAENTTLCRAHIVGSSSNCNSLISSGQAKTTYRIRRSGPKWPPTSARRVGALSRTGTRRPCSRRAGGRWYDRPRRRPKAWPTG